MENHYEEKKEHYEMMATAFRVGYVSAKQGKHIPMFDKSKDGLRRGKITKEDKAKQFAELDNIFGR